MPKSIKRVKTLSHAQLSSIARKAANSAWRFMHSAKYQAIKNSSRTPKQKRAAIEALKAARA